VINAGRHCDAFGQRHKGNRASAEIARVYTAQREEVSVLVQGELGFRCQVRPWKSVRNASRRSQLHLTGCLTRFAAQATSTNSGQVLLRIPKFPPTSLETTRTASFVP
jgi:hypothetical protein